jgi:hypothetical protein
MKIATYKMYWPLLAILAFSPGCFLFSDFRKEQFVAGASQQPIDLRIPKGYKRKEIKTDSSGNTMLTYFYDEGQQLFFSSGNRLAAYIDTIQHFPRPHIQGGIFYKGVLPKLSLWREVYSQGMRYGYRYVALDAEPKFDSSLNYVRIGR